MEAEQEDKMIKNWNVYCNLIGNKLSKTHAQKLTTFLDEKADKIIPAPASTRNSYVGSFSGGLVWHSLNVLKNMKELNKIYNLNLSTDDLIITGLLHDIGKIGTEEEDYYMPPKSSWHRDKGFNYQINQNLENVSVQTLSLVWLNKYNIDLTHQVIEAIQSVSLMGKEGYSNMYRVQPLTMVLLQAIQASSVCNKGKEKL